MHGPQLPSIYAPNFPKYTLKLPVGFPVLVASCRSFLLFFSPTWSTTSLTLAFQLRFPDKGFGFSSIPLSKVGCGARPHASLVSLFSPWSVDCDRVQRFPSSLDALVSGNSWAERCILFRKKLNSAPISLLLNKYSFEVAVPPLIASSLGSDGIEDGLMVGMLVLGGGGGHVVAVVPKSVEQMDLFWS